MKSKSILRKALSVFTAMAMSFSFMTFSAVGVSALEVGDVFNSGSCGENATWTLTKNGVDEESNDTYTLTISGTGAMENYSNPSPAPWKSACSDITAVIIDGNITHIGGYAFQGFYLLTSITIPASVETIGHYTFDNCTNLETIEVESGSKLSDIASSYTLSDTKWFNKNENRILNGILVKYVFGDDNTTVTIPEGVKKIQTELFFGNTTIKTVSIPSSVETIGDRAFSSCTGITEITIPSSVKTIGRSAFSSCTSLTEITIPSSVETMDSSIFWGCTGLTKATIEEGVESIGESMFQNCTGLTEVIIEEGVKSIGRSAFSGCTNLETINLPSTIEEIGRDAFKDVESISSENGFVILDGVLIKYTGNATEIIIPEEVRVIGGNAFFNNDNITSVEIPSGVTSIGKTAFAGCENLASVEMPESVETIGEKAFWACDSLNGVTIPSGVKVISDCAFQSCIALTEITIPKGVTEIGVYAFGDCDTLETVNFEEGSKLKTIGYLAFGYCHELETITIPEGVTTIDENAFESCTALDEITIPLSITTIGEEAFLDCTSLTKVNLPCNWNDSIFTFDESVEKIIAEHTSSGPATSTTPEKCTVCGYIISPATGSNNNSSSGGSSSSSDESPNIEGKNGKKGWSAILDVIEDTKEGEKVVIDMNDATELPKNILKEIKGKDIAIVLNMDNGFIWTINGKDVENPKTIDMGVKKGTRIPVKVINEVTGESEYIEITLSHNGDFGFKAVLTVDMGKNNKGNFANLYYYNGKEMDIICSDEIDENGKADLTFTHASEYVIVIDDTDHTDLSAGESIKVEEIVLL